MNPNTEYEHLVAQIHQSMLQYDGYENIRVEHDVKIIGKSGASHQIDVYWEFKAAGTTYKTCVECKNYTSAVKKTHVAAFAEILRDIGNANGIIATTLSFQKGAKQLAEQNNIRLVLVNHLIQSIKLRIQPLLTHCENARLNFNEQSIKEAMLRNGLKSYTANLQLCGDEPLYDRDGNFRETVNTEFRKHRATEGENTINFDGLYIKLEDIGLVLLDSLVVDVSFPDVPAIESVIAPPNMANAAIEDIVDKNIMYLHDDGRIRPKSNQI